MSQKINCFEKNDLRRIQIAQKPRIFLTFPLDDLKLAYSKPTELKVISGKCRESREEWV